MDVIEILLRGAAVGLDLALAVAFARGGRTGSARWSGVALCLAAAAFALHSGGPETRAVGWLYGVIWMASVTGTAWLWVFAATLFDDRPLTPALLTPVGGMLVIGAVGSLAPGGVAVGVWIAFNLLQIMIIGHVALVVWRGWRGDLVESRRTVRGPFMLAVTAFCLFQSGIDISQNLGQGPAWAGMAQAVALTLLGLGGAVAFLDPRLAFTGRPGRRDPVAPDAVPAQDRPLLARLEVLMSEEEIWRREGLTIGQLAEAVGAPEHRLRRLINGALGHRNFAEFLNVRRIEAARTALADPANARASVSALAFELGYASLGPFNRAFKDATGETPTAWRLKALDGSPTP